MGRLETAISGDEKKEVIETDLFVHEDDVRHYLDAYARALTSGDAKALARMWSVPALVMSDQGVRQVESLVEVEHFFEGAADQYIDRGIVDTRPDIQYVEWLTERIVVADVHWPMFDENHVERGSEYATYTLMRDDAGELKMRVVVMRSTPESAKAGEGAQETTGDTAGEAH